MPLYEYRCENCNELFEVRQKFVDEPITVHEKCGGKVVRVLSAPAFQFKGSGFYITDYARGGNSTPANGGSKKSGDAPGSTSGGSDSGSTSSSSDKKSSSSDTK